VFVCVCACVCVCVCVCGCVCVCVWCVRECVYVCVYVCAYVSIWICTYACVCVYTSAAVNNGEDMWHAWFMCATRLMTQDKCDCPIRTCDMTHTAPELLETELSCKSITLALFHRRPVDRTDVCLPIDSATWGTHSHSFTCVTWLIPCVARLIHVWPHWGIPHTNDSSTCETCLQHRHRCNMTYSQDTTTSHARRAKSKKTIYQKKVVRIYEGSCCRGPLEW